MHNFYFPPSPSSTPWAPSWAPDGESIAVAMSGSIWQVDPDTGVAEELTYSPDAYHSSPDWSPDGRWVVYTADHDGERVQLELLEVATGESRALTSDDHVYADPTFSPDGTRIAYVSTRPNGYFNVAVRPVEEGRWAGDEMPITSDHAYPANRLYFGPWDMHMTPAWLPAAPESDESDELLLVSNRDIPLGSGNVLRVPSAPGGIGSAVTVLREQTLYRTRPDVASDGRRFVYSSTRGAADQFNNLYVQPTAGGRALQADVLPARRLSSALVSGRRVDRVHHQRGRPAAARTARDARGGVAHGGNHRTPVAAAHRHPVGPHPRGGHRGRHGGADPSHRVGRQVLRPAPTPTPA